MVDIDKDAEITRLRSGLQRIDDRYNLENRLWRSDRKFATDYSKAWHDGFVTALATASLIASEHLDPEAWAKNQDEMRAAGWASDKDWFERTGNCGRCGNPGEDCCCPLDDPCGCGPHLNHRTEPRP